MRYLFILSPQKNSLSLWWQGAGWLSGHDQVSNCVMTEMLKVMKSWEEGNGTQIDEWAELSLSEPHRHQETSILGSVTCQLITATSQT